MLLTITLFSPSILLTKEDFPTFGFPINATLTTVPSSSLLSDFGSKSNIASNTSPIPMAFLDETAYGSPSPKL